MLEGTPANIAIDLKNGLIIQNFKRKVIHEFDKKMKYSEFKQMLNEIMKGEL